jgi:hypothetical protein
MKAQKCKAVAKSKTVVAEILPPPEPLKKIEAQLTPVVDLIERKSVDLLYDIVTAGLFLMKAQNTHRCATVAHAADGKFAGSEDDTGFQGWLEEKYPRISRRSAYNYINGAKNCGLTITDDTSAISKLRKTHALAGKTASDIYKLQDKPEDTEEEEQGTKWNLIRDAAVNFRQHSETVVELRPEMSKKAHSTVCARALRTLEELTGSTWDIVPSRKGNHFREHGDVYEIGS